MKVLKFGGTSVGSAESIAILAEIVERSREAAEQPLVVCSAMSGVTNLLIQLTGQAAAGRNTADLMWEIREKHLVVIENFFCENQPVSGTLEPLFAELQLLLGGISALQECSLRTKDKVMALGEQLSCSMVAAILDQRFGNVVYTDARRLIATNSNFGHAVVNEAITNERIRSWYARLQGATPVVTGFIAADAKGDTTTLGRGGSDYTASLFGSALGADEIQIWTDVDGFMTADPRLVKNAFTLKELSYKEAMELSYFGAKVIYPPTLIPAFAGKIPIQIKNTFNPDQAGTAIHPQPTGNGSLIRGISSIQNISLINVEGTGMVGLKGFGGRLFSAMASAGVNVILITQASSEHSISFAVAPDDSLAALEAIQTAFEMELYTNRIEAPKVMHNLSILAVVGENMRKTSGLSAKLFQSLGRSGVNVVAIAQGSSELNISVVIDAGDLSKALNAVHDSLFLSPVKTIHLFLAGTGTIGAELLRQIAASSENLRQQHQLNVNVMGIINSRRMVVGNGQPIQVDHWEEILFEQGEPADMESFVKDIQHLNLPNSVFVDNTGSVSLPNFYTRLMENHLSVVCCNKTGPSSDWENYRKLLFTARRHDVAFLYETNVGAGLPVIKTMQDLLLSGDRILKMEAVLSGTISYIFNSYNGNRNFAEVVREAQAKGFTEPDPRDDLNGGDFARKLLILARETGLEVDLSDVVVEPILPDSCLSAPSVDEFYQALEAAESHFNVLKEQALSSNSVLRYIGEVSKGCMTIKLSFADAGHPFYNLSGSDNIIAFTTDRYRNNPLVIKGPGAGAAVTAAGVFADILRAARV